MDRKTFFNRKLLSCTLLIFTLCQGCTSWHQKQLIISCSEENDLYRILIENNIQCLRFNTPIEAVEMAKEGSGVFILADGYPEETTSVDSSLFEKAKEKKLRLYIEYPSYLPGLKILRPGQPAWKELLSHLILSGDLH